MIGFEFPSSESLWLISQNSYFLISSIPRKRDTSSNLTLVSSLFLICTVYYQLQNVNPRVVIESNRNIMEEIRVKNYLTMPCLMNSNKILTVDFNKQTNDQLKKKWKQQKQIKQTVLYLMNNLNQACQLVEDQADAYGRWLRFTNHHHWQRPCSVYYVFCRLEFSNTGNLLMEINNVGWLQVS